MNNSEDILFEVRGHMGLITLNRPKALNALTSDMCVALHGKLGEWAEDDAVRAVVIQGAGEKAFCAGGDVVSLYHAGKAGDPAWKEFFWNEYRMNAAIHHFPKPYIALVDGISMGGGVGISVHGSHRVVTERTLFAMPETGLGLIPDVGGSYFLPRLDGEIGMYLGLLGSRLKAGDLVRLGIATHYVPGEKLAGLIADLAASDLTSGEHIAKILEDATDNPGFSPTMKFVDAIDYCFNHDSVEKIMGALTDEGSDWALQVRDEIAAKSPTSVKVTFRQIREGQGMSFNECLRMEYRIVNQLLGEGHDFYEGVRALLIDKDQSPKWNPPLLSEVSEDRVAAHFAELGEDELSFD